MKLIFSILMLLLAMVALALSIRSDSPVNIFLGAFFVGYWGSSVIRQVTSTTESK